MLDLNRGMWGAWSWHPHCVSTSAEFAERGGAVMTTHGTFSRILVPTDFSRGSEKAWEMAKRMAADFGAELVLLHVLPATPLNVEMQLEAEERRAELRSLQAAHQLGIPRAEEPAAPAARVFEGPFTKETLLEFSPAGRAWAELLEAWATGGHRLGAKVRLVLRVGLAHHEILDEAEEAKVDLVLMATHGRGEVHRLLVGSVADRVIRMATCPVLTVKAA